MHDIWRKNYFVKNVEQLNSLSVKEKEIALLRISEIKITYLPKDFLEKIGLSPVFSEGCSFSYTINPKILYFPIAEPKGVTIIQRC